MRRAEIYDFHTKKHITDLGAASRDKVIELAREIAAERHTSLAVLIEEPDGGYRGDRLMLTPNGAKWKLDTDWFLNRNPREDTQ